MEKREYTESELLACVAAKILENGSSVFVGTGLPMIASMLAQKTHAPDLLIIFEAGGIGPIMPVLPISVGDSRTFHRAVAASSMHDAMSLAQSVIQELSTGLWQPPVCTMRCPLPRVDMSTLDFSVPPR